MSVEIKSTVSLKAKKDILDLQKKINDFAIGQTPEDKFKHFRLTRGVYGQRQTGVQMVRIKLPYGKITADQLIAIANSSDKFSTGNLHLTTRQDIQLHYIKLNDSPQLWADLEAYDVTLREACGNTVRNVTGSDIAGIDPNEPFDISPYAHELTHYFLRNPICQDMGRKIKIAFSSSEKDTALTFLHDLGFIPRIKTENGVEKRGFKVLIGGGLGAQAILAKTAFEFLEEDQLIPFSEAALRVFDRYGERSKRFKARLKFLIQAIGSDEFLRLVEIERIAIKNKSYSINRNSVVQPIPQPEKSHQQLPIRNENHFINWYQTNVFEQKQKGFYGVYIRVPLGNINSHKARSLAKIVKEFAGDDIRVTVNQGLLLKFVTKEALNPLFTQLDKLNLALAGFDSIHDITACPGSDTCNLAVTNSTALSTELESVLKQEYPQLINETKIKIKISGCMNSCGQHMIANIGFHGSSIKNGLLTAPAMQVVLGGGFDENGKGIVAEKIVKVPTKKIPDVLRITLDDFEEHSAEGEYFNTYFQRKGKMYFYHLLKPISDLEKLVNTDYIDWGGETSYSPEIGVGECAGISLDVIGTVINESIEKLEWAKEGLKESAFADSIYNSYSSLVIGAKALLLSVDKQCNTQIGIIKDFNETFIVKNKINLKSDFETFVLQINKNEPTREFAESYFADATIFLSLLKKFRKQQLEEGTLAEEKLVVNQYYTA